MASSRIREDPCSNEDCPVLEDMMSTLTINPEPGILKVEETVKKFYESLRTCSECQSDKIKDIPVDGGDTHIKMCQNCGHHFGLDDQSSVYDVHQIVKSWKANICPCGNSDLEDYVVTKADDGIGFRCQKCNSKIPLPHDHGLGSTTGGPTSAGASLIRNGVDEIKLKCQCGNEKEELFGMIFDPEHEDRLVGVKCHKCQYEWRYESQDDFCEDWTLPEQGDDRITKPAGRTEVSNAWGLHEGDHIAWWRPEGYWHHALAESIYPESNRVNVLHYNGPLLMGHKIKGKIVEEELDLGCQKGLLYRINYDGECYPAPIAIERGRRRLGETKYSLLTNNCEHFVRWCKTGFDKSHQVESVAHTLLRIGGKLTSCLSSKAAKAGLGKIFTKTVGLALSGAAAEASQVIGEGAALITGQKICECLGVCAIVGIEAGFVVRDIYNANEQRQNGQISRDEFINVVVRRTAQGLGGAAGAAAGTYLGQALIPIPVVGALVGCTLGALIGHTLGHYGGYLFAFMRRKEDQDQYISADSFSEGT